MTEPLVLVIVGTDHHPFNRLVGWMDHWARKTTVPVRCFVQSGTSTPPEYVEWASTLPYDRLRELMRAASVVITHGGPGTIMDVRQSGLVPIVVPRRHALGEHVDDHQVVFTDRIAAAGAIHVASEEKALVDLLEQALAGSLEVRAEPGTDTGQQAVECFGRELAALHARRRIAAGPGSRTLAPTTRPDLPRVLFIAGWGRSGSTLLDRMAGEAPGVASVGELRELWHRGCLEDRLCGCGKPFSECEFWTAVGAESFGGWPSFDAARAAALRDRLDRVWMAPALAFPRLFGRRVAGEQAEYHELLRRLYHGIAKVSGASVVVDSSKLATHGMLLHGAGVPTAALHLVRDSRGVMHSWQKRVERPDGTGDLMIRYGTASGSARYLVYNALAQSLQALGMDYRRVRYEDLVADPATVLPAVLDHAGIESTPVRDGAALPLGTHHTVDGNPMRFSVGPVRLKVDDAWRRAMPRDKRAIVSTITAPLLLAYGYAGRRRRPGQASQAGQAQARQAPQAPADPAIGARTPGSRVGMRVRRIARTAAATGLRATPGVRPAPDFLVIGAQRCGTTSLFRALSAHPGVLSPVLGTKGVHFFDTSYDRSLEWYLAHFPTVAARRRVSRRAGVPVVTGEASPYYVFHPAAPARIARDVPDVRLILMLRDPVSRAYSHYNHMRYEGHETATSFEDAIDLEPGRLAGEEERLISEPGYVSKHHQHHSYLARGDYARQIERLQALFRPEQLLVLDSSRFFAEPQKGLAQVQSFLELPTSPAVVLRALNGSGVIPPLRPDVEQRLREHFEPSDRQLVRLLGWSPSWCDR